MPKRTAGEALPDRSNGSSGGSTVYPHHMIKRRKIGPLTPGLQTSASKGTNSEVSVHDRKWRPMEICCILELVVHSDVAKVYADNPNLDASTLDAQDWNAISLWMTEWFSTAQPFWFSSNSLPKTPYSASECKQCAMDMLTRHHPGYRKTESNGLNAMNGIKSKMNKMSGLNASHKLPARFADLSALCNATRKIYVDHTLKILDSRRSAIYNEMKNQSNLQSNHSKTNDLKPNHSKSVKSENVKLSVAPSPNTMKTMKPLKAVHSKLVNTTYLFQVVCPGTSTKMASVLGIVSGIAAGGVTGSLLAVACTVEGSSLAGSIVGVGYGCTAALGVDILVDSEVCKDGWWGDDTPSDNINQTAD